MRFWTLITNLILFFDYDVIVRLHDALMTSFLLFFFISRTTCVGIVGITPNDAEYMTSICLNALCSRISFRKKLIPKKRRFYQKTKLPENMEPLLAYKQEATCRARWLTTASGCRHLLQFDVCRLDERERAKLIGLISYVVSVYIPSFVTIQLKPLAAEGPGITLFERNLLLAYNEIDSELAEVALKYFYDHAQQWVTPINAALNVYAEVPPYCVNAVQTGHFPDAVDA